MKIRHAMDSDYKELMELFNLFVGKDRYSSFKNDSFKTVQKNSRNFVYVAEVEGALIGFASMSARDVIRYPGPIVELDELFVKEDYRKSGVGKMLMDEVENKAKNLKCSRIFIGSYYERKTAHKFYEALGYTNMGYQYVKYL